MLHDTDDNLVSTLYHALQGAETAGVDMEDAKQAGDDELNDYFRDARQQYEPRAKQLLTKRME